MKRKILMIIFMLLFSVVNMFSAELWNGLTTDMTKEEVKSILANKANIKLSDKSYFGMVDSSMILGSDYHLNGYYFSRFTGIPDFIFDSRKQGYESLLFRSRNKEFCRYDSSKKRDYTDFELAEYKLRTIYSANIICSFYENKLFAVLINWATDEDSLKSMVDKQFGIPFRKEIPTYEGFGGYILEGRPVYFPNVYIAIGNALDGGFSEGGTQAMNGSKYFVIDTSVPKRIMQQQLEEQKRREREEIERNSEAAKGVKF